jgi:hypothetical protein
MIKEIVHVGVGAKHLGIALLRGNGVRGPNALPLRWGLVVAGIDVRSAYIKNTKNHFQDHGNH